MADENEADRAYREGREAIARAEWERLGIVANRYWNSNGMGIAVAAVLGGAPDWAAYVGAQPNPASEYETTAWAARFGCKLSEAEALAFFPHLARHPERPPYRA